jgi:hypothetical protein
VNGDVKVYEYARARAVGGGQGAGGRGARGGPSDEVDECGEAEDVQVEGVQYTGSKQVRGPLE